MPATPYDAKGLLKAAIRDDNPVIFIEHKMLTMEPGTGPVPEDDYIVPFGVASICREGNDVTLIAISGMVRHALSAAERLEADGISVEVIDPRTLVPLDEETILASVRKTNRVVIAHEAFERGGFGGELAALIGNKAFDDLDAPIERVAGANTPVPFAPELEKVVIPGEERIVTAVRKVTGVAPS